MTEPSEQYIQELTDKANRDINSQCPQLTQEVKPHITRAVLRAKEWWDKKK